RALRLVRKYRGIVSRTPRNVDGPCTRKAVPFFPQARTHADCRYRRGNVDEDGIAVSWNSDGDRIWGQHRPVSTMGAHNLIRGVGARDNHHHALVGGEGEKCREATDVVAAANGNRAEPAPSCAIGRERNSLRGEPNSREPIAIPNDCGGAIGKDPWLSPGAH